MRVWRLSVAGVLGATLLLPITASAQSDRIAEARLKEKNIVLPAETASLGNYVNAVQAGNLLYVSGTIAGANWNPKEGGEGGHARGGVSGRAPSWHKPLARARGPSVVSTV